MADTARLFVAVLPPEEVLDRVAALRRPDEPGVRYTTRAQWHVTLRFLGKAVVSDAVEALARVRAEPVDAVLGPQVARLGRSVVVVPVAGLGPVAAAVDLALDGIGEPSEGHRFTGHLTVARLRNRAACGVAGERITGSFRVDEIHLVRSYLDPAGARYEVLARRALG